ncbi:hypothetical protein ACFWIA_08745 [Streptomyces sp. NPDC127068]|uniref:hypothetical protein n=1 Tax=Streptomyces sp. NPDC127068 TaxID=3347127 RepID=UPI003653A8BF
MTRTTRTTDARSTPVRPRRRLRLTVAATALGALALAAAGATTANAGNTTAKPTATAAAEPRVDPEVQFVEMLSEVEASCPTEDVPLPPPLVDPEGDPFTEGDLPGDRSRAERELTPVEWCAKHRHEERVTQALDDLKKPTPDEVRKVLNRLGYLDGRIDHLKRSGATTKFVIDLRVLGGKLALKGTAAGPDTVVDGFAAAGSGPLVPAKRT